MFEDVRVCLVEWGNYAMFSRSYKLNIIYNSRWETIFKLISFSLILKQEGFVK